MTSDIAERFAKASWLYRDSGPTARIRQGGMQFASFTIVDLRDNVWWAPFIGITFLGFIRETEAGLHEAVPVRLRGRSYVYGRSIPMDFVTIN